MKAFFPSPFLKRNELQEDRRRPLLQPGPCVSPGPRGPRGTLNGWAGPLPGAWAVSAWTGGVIRHLNGELLLRQVVGKQETLENPSACFSCGRKYRLQILNSGLTFLVESGFGNVPLSWTKMHQHWFCSPSTFQAVPFTFLSETSLCPGFFIFHHNFLNEWRAPDRWRGFPRIALAGLLGGGSLAGWGPLSRSPASAKPAVPPEPQPLGCPRARASLGAHPFCLAGATGLGFHRTMRSVGPSPQVRPETPWKLVSAGIWF